MRDLGDQFAGKEVFDDFGRRPLRDRRAHPAKRLKPELDESALDPPVALQAVGLGEESNRFEGLVGRDQLFRFARACSG